MEVTKNKPYFDTLEKGQVLTVTITGGSAIVCGKVGTREVIAENPTTTTIYGPYASDINFRVSYVSGVIDATESISSTPLFPQQITLAAFSAAQASGSLDTSAMYDVDGILYRYNRSSGLWLSSDVDTSSYKFISGRYKVSQSFGSHSSTNIYALHQSKFVSPEYPVSDPRFFLGAFACTGTLFPVDRYAEGQLTYYGLAIKVAGTWYRITDSTDPTVGLDFTSGTKVGPIGKGLLTAAASQTSSAAIITVTPRPAVGDVVLFKDGSTRVYSVITSVIANGSDWQVTADTYSTQSVTTTTPQSLTSSTTEATIFRNPGFLTPAIGVTIPANTTVEVQLLYAAPGGSAVPGQDFQVAGYVPTQTKLDVEYIVGTSDRTSTPAGCLASLNAMYGTDLLSTSSAPVHSGMTYTNGNIKRIHTPFFCVAKGSDGRMVGLIAGDSIGFGSNDEVPTYYDSAYGAGYIERGLNENVTSKRVPFAVFAEKGTSQVKYQSKNHWKPRLDTLRMIYNVNGGVWPFDIVFEESGTNATASTSYATAMVTMLGIMKDEWQKPIIGVGLLPKCTSTDGWQSLANQATIAADTRYPAGRLWLTNAAKGCLNTTNDPSATWQVTDSPLLALDLLDDSISVWKTVSYDTDANRDKVAVRQFTGTLSANLTVNTYSFSVTQTAGVAPRIGESLLIDPTGTTQEITIDGVTDNGGGSFTLTGFPSGFGQTTAASSGVALSIAHLGSFSGSALHPSPWACENLLKAPIVEWKRANGLAK